MKLSAATEAGSQPVALRLNFTDQPVEHQRLESAAVLLTVWPFGAQGCIGDRDVGGAQNFQDNSANVTVASLVESLGAGEGAVVRGVARLAPLAYSDERAGTALGSARPAPSLT